MIGDEIGEIVKAEKPVRSPLYNQARVESALYQDGHIGGGKK